MLVLSRKNKETIEVNGPCVITILETHGNRVKVGIDADKEITIIRGELNDNRRTDIKKMVS